MSLRLFVRRRDTGAQHAHSRRQVSHHASFPLRLRHRINKRKRYTVQNEKTRAEKTSAGCPGPGSIQACLG
ncbi:Hypothetical predicted protein [Xyrichtys novacula]|uniref:Uncharacterized protein n=1 Tax=Xyrichtys novacula TaxID=13765 RepID=A0AAV1FAN5_XYRNO|nr:Hypothetical predicted protein [Xyrichtys novacula]